MPKFFVAAAAVMASVGVLAGSSSAEHGPNHGLCEGRNATIHVQEGSDVTLGTRGDDVIQGGNGPDVIRGRRGDDTICGNKGNDLLLGNGGDDKLSGGHANDRLIGGKGFDKARGRAGTQDYCKADVERKCEEG